MTTDFTPSALLIAFRDHARRMDDRWRTPDAGERDLWRALANEIDGYMPGDEQPGPDLFGGDT